MRSMERNIRALKREREAIASLGMDTEAVFSKIKGKIKGDMRIFAINAERSRTLTACGMSAALLI